jgi:hypothetical protein
MTRHPASARPCDWSSAAIEDGELVRRLRGAALAVHRAATFGKGLDDVAATGKLKPNFTNTL